MSDVLASGLREFLVTGFAALALQSSITYHSGVRRLL